MIKYGLRKYLSDDDLAAIAESITLAERSTAGEIRVSVLLRRTLKERKLSVEEIAHRDFHRLEMQKTKDRTGILIVVLFKERQFHIVADEGIHRRVEDGSWDRIAEAMTTHFREGHYRAGICHAVTSVGSVLAQHFPKHPDDTNELTNSVDVR